MGPLNAGDDPGQDFNDSGYVQEEAAKEPPKAEEPELCKTTIDLLDLSDDVLLYILQYCSPMDLKALGFACSRLSTLILDRTLWQRVDSRDRPCGKMRVRWLLTHGISSHTTCLRLTGYAREAKGCLGYMTGSRDDNTAPAPEDMQPWNIPEQPPSGEDGPRLFRLSANALPRYGGGFPFWPINMAQPVAAGQSSMDPTVPEPTGHRCPGPQITLTHWALARLYHLCTNLKELALEHCVIDCNTTTIAMFPKTLTKLSLLGTKCFNLEKSFLHKIQDRLINLEDLDISYCEWVEPACMLPLSKMPVLSRLVMQHCPKLSEFVAYASLATRYGFKILKILDLRGSPVGDSEVSALGWLPLLEELYLSCASAEPRHADHAHFSRDPPPEHKELEQWEEQEPEFYKCKYPTEQWVLDEESGCLYKDFPPDQPSLSSRCVLLTRMINEPNPERQLADQVWDDYIRHRDAADNARNLNYDPNDDPNDPNDAPDPPINDPNDPVVVHMAPPVNAPNAPDAPNPPNDAPNAPIDGANLPNNDPNAPIDGANPPNNAPNPPDAPNPPNNAPDAPNDAQNDQNEARKRNVRARNRELRNRGPTGYIISNVGYVRRTFHMYPGDDRLYEYVNGQVERVVGNGRGDEALERDRNEAPRNIAGNGNVAGNQNEAGNSNEARERNEARNRIDVAVNEVISGLELELKRRHEDEQNAGPSKRSKDPEENEPNELNEPNNPNSNETCATKAAKKFFDDENCQVSRSFIKKSIEDFKKRTENSQYKPPDKFDFDSFDGTMKDDDDDDEDDGKPTPKRGRVGVEVNVASTSNAGGTMETNNSVVETNNSVVETNDPVVETNNSVVETDNSVVETNNSVVETNKPVVETNNSVVETDNSVVETNNSVVETNKPVVETNDPVVETNDPVVENDSRVEFDKSNVSANDSNEPRLSRRIAALRQYVPIPTPNEIRFLERLSNSILHEYEQNRPSTSMLYNSNRVSQPSTSKDYNQPSTSKDKSPSDDSRPSTSKEVSQSKTENSSENQPSTSTESKPQETSDGPTLKHDTQSIDQPSTSKPDSDQPSNSKQDTSNPASKDSETTSKDGSESKEDKSQDDQPSTSKPDSSNKSDKQSEAANRYGQRYIRFRHNRPPVVVCGQNIPPYVPNNNNGEPDGNFRFFRRRNIIPIPAPDVLPYVRSVADLHCNGNQPAEGNADPGNADDLARHRILYVNVSRRRHAMYQISMPEPVDLRTPPNTAHMNLIYSSHLTPQVEYANLITDTAIRRFGRADGENVNYVNVGPMGLVPAVPGYDPNARPNRSNLRILSVTGYNHITNLSLVHLATAAPHLRTIDFTGTRVTETGVEHFRNLRPDCEVRYGSPDDVKSDTGRPSSR